MLENVGLIATVPVHCQVVQNIHCTNFQSIYSSQFCIDFVLIYCDPEIYKLLYNLQYQLDSHLIATCLVFQDILLNHSLLFVNLANCSHPLKRE